MAKTPVEKFLANYQPVLHEGAFVYRNLPAQGLIDSISATVEPAEPNKKKSKRKKKAASDPVASPAAS